MHTKGKVEVNGHGIYKLAVMTGHNEFSINVQVGCKCNECREHNTTASIEDLDYITNRIASLWNAADGMSTDEVVRYIEHGREMVELLARVSVHVWDIKPQFAKIIHDDLESLLTKLGGK
jgi:hypothetical protein